MQQKISAPQWDLTEIYKGLEDKRISSDLADQLEKARLFEKKYSGKIAKMNLARLLATLKEYESQHRKLFLLQGYAFFTFSADTSDPKANELMQRVELALTEIQNHLIFFNLELGKHPKLTAFIEDKKVGSYRFLFQKTLANKKYQLRADQERIINLKNVAANSGWVKLFAMQEAKLKVKYKGKELSHEQAIKLLHDSKRKVRKDISGAFSDALAKENPLFVHIFNMLLVDKMQEDQLRKYKNPEDSRHINNGVTQKAVDVLIAATKKNFGLVGKYYSIKKDLLGLDKLYTYDRYAPVLGVNKKYTFSEGAKIVREAFSSFDPDMAKIFDDLLLAKHIDARTRPNKRGGAYCAEMPKGHLPYILMNYVGEQRDVLTLAHESGHAVHDILAEKNPLLVAHPPLTMAETASVFAEMVVFEDLLSKAKTDKEKIALYASKIDDVFSTIYRQISFVIFERGAHALVKEKGSASAQELNDLWMETQRQMYGKSLAYPKGYKYWWEYISHFYEYPFYVYAYSFGNLLVFALWQEYKNAKKLGPEAATKFLQKYKRMLATGGTRSTMETLQRAGFDPEDPQFWQQGFNALKNLIAALSKLC